METTTGNKIYKEILEYSDAAEHHELSDVKFIKVDDFIKWFENNFDLDYGKDIMGHGFFIKNSWKNIMGLYNELKTHGLREK